jgi:hypothetical protein
MAREDRGETSFVESSERWGDDVVAFAVNVLERWRQEGFDTVGRYPTGYCYPFNSRATPGAVMGNELFPIDSPAALEAVAEAIDSGATYLLRPAPRRAA